MVDYVNICKVGCLYCVKTKEDMIILHFLLHYKRKNKDKNIIYFSKPSVVIDTLDKNHINYKYNNKLVTYEDNKYYEIYTNAYDKIALLYRINKLKNKINNLTIKEKLVLLDTIERELDERRV